MLQSGEVIWKGKAIPALLPGLSFDPQGHIYKVNGAQRKSVTQYLSGLQDHSFCSEIDMQWGTIAHDYLHKADAALLDYGSPKFDHRFDAYIKGWDMFCVKQGWNIVEMLAEYLIYSKKYLYTGRFDRLFCTENHDYLIDIKTGTPSKVTGIQLAAYGQAAIEWELTSKTRLRLMECCIDKDGKVRTQMFDFKTNWNYFLMAYSLQNHLNK